LSVAVRSRAVPLPVVAGIAGAWTLAVFAEVTGTGRLFHHDTLIEGGLSFWVALLVFAAAWQAMIAAMMLPSSLPFVRMFAATSREHRRPGLEMAAFLGGYGLVWTAFGVVAFVGDLLLHHMVDRTPWLATHPWLIASSVLVGAGLFQFSSLKERCLRECRHPAAYLLRFYRGGGSAGAFRLGRGHGLFCLGCCWALMLAGFAAGVANLWWMVGLTALMYYEKVRPAGARSAPIAGVVFLAMAVVVFAHPAWLPAAFRAA
jgi:predicted metal-binding membrane protein